MNSLFLLQGHIEFAILKWNEESLANARFSRRQFEIAQSIVRGLLIVV
jgi:hypothetical protein